MKNKTKTPSAGAPAQARNTFWRTLDNLKVTLGTKAAWSDHLMAFLGGTMYVILPTAIEAIFRVDLTGWRGYITSMSTNLVIGGALRSPGYMAGVMGVGAAHLIYARGQDAIIRPIFRKYAYRFDPTETRSAMSDDVPTTAPVTPPLGTQVRTIGGERVHLYPPSPNAAKVEVAPAALPAHLSNSFQPTLENNFQSTLENNFQSTLENNFQPTLEDTFQRSLMDSYQRSLMDGYQQAINDSWSSGWAGYASRN
ncbi:MAG: hypothetical protein FGM24_09890 [Candidatus Kapabacteria bacterium]|nr:hypothetical protein [Candidatus Kapabacteria bacterium]